MINKQKENGSSTVELLLGIIAVALITLTGFYMYNSSKNHSPEKSVKSKATNSQPQNEQQYLSVSELGIKVPVPEGISDLSKEAAPADNVVGISTKSYEDAVAACQSENQASGSYRAIVSVSKHEGTYDEARQFDQIGAYNTFAKQFDTYFISHGAADGSPCADDAEPAAVAKVNILLKSQKPLIIESIKKAEKL